MKTTTLRTTRYRAGDGTQIAADVGGEESAASVILLHGAGQTRHSWSGAMEALLAAGYHVVNVDARGHGESQWAVTGDYSFETQAGDVKAVIDSLSTRPALVGASMGGVSCLTLLGTDPSIASALVLVDIVPHLRMEGSERIRAFMTRHTAGFASVEEAAAAVREYNPHRRGGNNAGLMKNLRQDEHGRLHWHWDPGVMSTFDEPKLREERLDDAAQRIKIPSMLVRGLRSDVVSDSGVEDLRALMPHLEVVNVSEASHMVAGDKNDVFNDSVLNFLGRHR